MSLEQTERIVRLPKGTRVRVPRGTWLVYDTSPNSVLPSATRRAQTVVVHWMTHHPNAIYWAGSGGYWKGVLLTDETQIEECSS